MGFYHKFFLFFLFFYAIKSASFVRKKKMSANYSIINFKFLFQCFVYVSNKLNFIVFCWSCYEDGCVHNDNKLCTKGNVFIQLIEDDTNVKLINSKNRKGKYFVIKLGHIKGLTDRVFTHKNRKYLGWDQRKSHHVPMCFH